MLILNMLLRITNYTQEELANFVGVSRASINSWLINDTTMSNHSKENIANKFQFPVSYFDIDLNQDLNLYKIVFSTLYESWKRVNLQNNEEIDDMFNKINKILNEVVSDYKETDYNNFKFNNISESEILEGLSNGYNPFTGEMFDENHILNNVKVKTIITKMKDNYKNRTITFTKEDLDEEQRILFEKLRKWRKVKTEEEGFHNAYIVFTDRELFNIIFANIKNIEDLRKVKGIGNIKYQKYAHELYKIIKKYKDEEKFEDSFSTFGNEHYNYQNIEDL